MVNYNNGKIYKIEPICDHEENEIYIGSNIYLKEWIFIEQIIKTGK